MPMHGLKQHLARLKRLRGPETTRLVEQALFAGGELIETEAQRLISTGSVSGQGHVPSSPGEAPNFDSGVLSNNIETTRAGKLHVQVRSEAPYASPLEFGTSKMAARPYMGPARDNKRREVTAMVRSAMDAAVKKSG